MFTYWMLNGLSSSSCSTSNVFVRYWICIPPGQWVLDAGTETGEDAQEMAKLVAPDGQVVGLDLSQITIEETKRRYLSNFCTHALD
jgi:ubiquinone/menaquinone biosynthesis C-methylase UbiE